MFLSCFAFLAHVFLFDTSLHPAPSSCVIASRPPARTTTLGPAPSEPRKYDLIVYGATGFTGTLVAKYLAATAPPSLKFALAGRSEAKLQALASSISSRSVPIVVADGGYAAALKSLALSATTVITTAGPYTLYGKPLLAACALAGTNYADLSGEFFFQKDMILEYDAAAAKSGAKIVIASGYDSVPFDLGTDFALSLLDARKCHWRGCEANTRSGCGGESASPASVALTKVTSVVTVCHGAASGGTIASAAQGLKDMYAGITSGSMTLADTQDPYMLVPEAKGFGLGCVAVDTEATGWGSLPRFDWTARVLGVPHFMAYINSRVVRRSQYLLRPARRLSYREGMSVWSLVDAMLWGAPYFWSEKDKLGPAQGEGPSPDMQLNGGFEVKIFAEERDAGGKQVGDLVEIKCVGAGDPGACTCCCCFCCVHCVF